MASLALGYKDSEERQETRTQGDRAWLCDSSVACVPLLAPFGQTSLVCAWGTGGRGMSDLACEVTDVIEPVVFPGGGNESQS